VFCLPQHLTTAAADVFGRLAAADRLRGLNREQFIGQVAEFLADVNALHPFREGTDAPSGRSSPSSPTTPGTTSNGSAWTPTANAAASAAAHHGDLAPLTEMLGDLIDLPHPPGPLGPGGRRAA
jgi:cell filamentation protein